MPRLQNWKMPSKPDGWKPNILLLGGVGKKQQCFYLAAFPACSIPGTRSQPLLQPIHPFLLEMVYRAEKISKTTTWPWALMCFLPSSTSQCCYMGSLVWERREEVTPGPALPWDAHGAGGSLVWERRQGARVVVSALADPAHGMMVIAEVVTLKASG